MEAFLYGILLIVDFTGLIALCMSLRRMPFYERVLLCIILLTTLALLVFGTSDQAENQAQDWLSFFLGYLLMFGGVVAWICAAALHLTKDRK